MIFEYNYKLSVYDLNIEELSLVKLNACIDIHVDLR